MQNQYDLTSAYDSRHVPPPRPKQGEGWRPNRFNGYGLPWGIHFGSYLTVANYKPENLRSALRSLNLSGLQGKSTLKAADLEAKPSGDYRATTNDHFVVFSTKSLASVVHLIYAFSLVVVVLSPISMVLLAWSRGSWSYFTDSSILLFIIICVLILALSKHSLDKGWVKPKIKAILFRSTGMVHTFRDKGGPPVIKPFTEFRAFLNSCVNPKSGALHYSLFLSHYEDNDLWFGPGSETGMQDKVYLEWEMIQQFMDISKPLPDVPELEPYRRLDPTTAEWDRQHNRPPKLFEEMTNKTFAKYRSAEIDYWKDFPWGSTREAAIAEGWQPPPEEFWKMDVGQSQSVSE